MFIAEKNAIKTSYQHPTYHIHLEEYRYARKAILESQKIHAHWKIKAVLKLLKNKELLWFWNIALGLFLYPESK